MSDRDEIAFLDLLYRVFIWVRAESNQTHNLPGEQMHDLMDAIHNVPLFLQGNNPWFTAEKLRDYYLASYDERWAKDGRGLVAMLDDAYARFDAS